MKQYTVTFVVRAVINRREEDDYLELPDPRHDIDSYTIISATEPEVLDIETITEHDSM
jgi:hypothetical protein